MSSFAKITTREHYGLRLALRLAQTYYHKKPISLSKISKQEKISQKYLEQLIVPFKKAGWIKSIRGRNGGYLMIKDPDSLTLKDFMTVLDDNPEDMNIVYCLDKNLSKPCPLSSNCSSLKAWRIVQDSLENTMQQIKFSTLIK